MKKAREIFVLAVLLATAFVPAVFFICDRGGLNPATSTLITTLVMAFMAYFVVAFTTFSIATVAVIAFAATSLAIGPSLFVFAGFAVVAVVIAASIAVAVAKEMELFWWQVMALLAIQATTIFYTLYLYTSPGMAPWSYQVVICGLTSEFLLWLHFCHTTPVDKK